MARLRYSSATAIASPGTSLEILLAPPEAGRALRYADLLMPDDRVLSPAGVLSTTPSGALPDFFGPEGVSTLYALLDDGTTVTLSLAADGAGGSGTSGTFGDWIYGDGSDGSITLTDGAVLLPGNYVNVTIPEGVTVTLPRPSTTLGSTVVYCSGTFTINGTVDLSGANRAAGRLNPDADDVPLAGDAGTAGNFGPFPGGAGGAGAAGAGGVAGAQTAIAPIAALVDAYNKLGTNTPGGGAGDGSFYGGAPGTNGNWFILIAKTIAHGANNLYLLGGGDGGDGGDDGAGNLGNGNCGGGGGGGGGWWMTICNTITGSANESGSGGAGGQGCGTGTDGLPGTTGRGIHLFNHTA